jgi:hypothetical protein
MNSPSIKTNLLEELKIEDKKLLSPGGLTIYHSHPHLHLNKAAQ